MSAMYVVGMGKEPMRERRWLVVTQDGDHTTLGRHSDPSHEEVAKFGASLDEKCVAGWLVISEGGYYNSEPVTLTMVHRITKRDGDWTEAERRWHQIRIEKNLGPPTSAKT